jgi:hypothetical protein
MTLITPFLPAPSPQPLGPGPPSLMVHLAIAFPQLTVNHNFFPMQPTHNAGVSTKTFPPFALFGLEIIPRTEMIANQA